MKDYKEIFEMLEMGVGEDVIGYFEREKVFSDKKVKVFTIVRQNNNLFSMPN